MLKQNIVFQCYHMFMALTYSTEDISQFQSEIIKVQDHFQKATNLLIDDISAFNKSYPIKEQEEKTVYLHLNEAFKLIRCIFDYGQNLIKKEDHELYDLLFKIMRDIFEERLKEYRRLEKEYLSN